MDLFLTYFLVCSSRSGCYLSCFIWSHKRYLIHPGSQYLSISNISVYGLLAFTNLEMCETYGRLKPYYVRSVSIPLSVMSFSKFNHFPGSRIVSSTKESALNNAVSPSLGNFSVFGPREKIFSDEIESPFLVV